MNYRELGKDFCSKINAILDKLNGKYALITGGGYSYDSTKYKNNEKQGDFDFMIVYENYEQLRDLISKLSGTSFDFEKKYLDLDLSYLKDDIIDIIRLSGNYKEIKSTINLVSINVIDKIISLDNSFTLRKIAHNRNTGLFFAYGTDGKRITTNFISPSFVTPDNEDHYVHLDFSIRTIDESMYFGILADAILKGFNENYDAIGFGQKRKQMIKNIHSFFKQHSIPYKNYIKIFANNRYFPDYIVDELQNEFLANGELINDKTIKSEIKKPPILLMLSQPNISYKANPFNFINQKEYREDFVSYLKKMQDNEYDRQYLIDAMAKFFGYLLYSSKNIECKTEKEPVKGIIDKFHVYGNNDIYFENQENSSVDLIMKSLLIDLDEKKENLNLAIYNEYVVMILNFMSYYKNCSIEEISNKFGYDLNALLALPLENEKMSSSVINRINDFESIGIYHNYTSRVMFGYTEKELAYLERLFPDKKGRVLDIMCGYGRIANGLRKKGYLNILGIDSNDYEFLHIDKDFTFVKGDFYQFQTQLPFQYLYSLYNCYANTEQLEEMFRQMLRLSSEDAVAVVDIFNKTWRDTVPSEFHKNLYDSSEARLDIERSYDSSSGIEKTNYIKETKKDAPKQFEFSQHFFDEEQIAEIINKSGWQGQIDNSDGNSRRNAQKHLLVLRR